MIWNLLNFQGLKNSQINLTLLRYYPNIVVGIIGHIRVIDQTASTIILFFNRYTQTSIKELQKCPCLSWCLKKIELYIKEEAGLKVPLLISVHKNQSNLSRYCTTSKKNRLEIKVDRFNYSFFFWKGLQYFLSMYLSAKLSF